MSRILLQDCPVCDKPYACSPVTVVRHDGGLAARRQTLVDVVSIGITTLLWLTQAANPYRYRLNHGGTPLLCTSHCSQRTTHQVNNTPRLRAVFTWHIRVPSARTPSFEVTLLILSEKTVTYLGTFLANPISLRSGRVRVHCTHPPRAPVSAFPRPPCSLSMLGYGHDGNWLCNLRDVGKKGSSIKDATACVVTYGSSDVSIHASPFFSMNPRRMISIASPLPDTSQRDNHQTLVMLIRDASTASNHGWPVFSFAPWWTLCHY
ncbi:hypothetical protein BDP55DRAFT_631874 [Colletotrichum godetiae]|uniref:Uncharacterized protein n=1 Tax=Colletotrichum godetiae TaxID=1209918 RepID=A0AAJ0EU22_9PEZI|nr:uncharacterized protein BDP55DRAFT_631874 [Colletotrichum godetiae]KAK1675682.1 hypothetical protein BDP55DRAFT_631874 [Colletotrichum godetiae]